MTTKFFKPLMLPMILLPAMMLNLFQDVPRQPTEPGDNVSGQLSLLAAQDAPGLQLRKMLLVKRHRFLHLMFK